MRNLFKGDAIYLRFAYQQPRQGGLLVAPRIYLVRIEGKEG
jgi:hypothetical protein